jgi:hypothetical protein
MKSILPTIPCAENVPVRVFESQSRKRDASAFSDLDKRIFRFNCGEEPPLKNPEVPDPLPQSITRNTNSMRLFCSRFIKIRKI